MKNRRGGDNPEYRKRLSLYKGSRWRRVRAEVLRDHPFCQTCAARGRRSLATVVDHIRGHGYGWEARFFDRSNLQAVCKTCHDRKTSYEVQLGGWNRKVELAKERGCDEDGEPVAEDHPWNAT